MQTPELFEATYPGIDKADFGELPIGGGIIDVIDIHKDIPRLAGKIFRDLSDKKMTETSRKQIDKAGDDFLAGYIGSYDILDFQLVQDGSISGRAEKGSIRLDNCLLFAVHAQLKTGKTPIDHIGGFAFGDGAHSFSVQAVNFEENGSLRFGKVQSPGLNTYLNRAKASGSLINTGKAGKTIKHAPKHHH